MTNDPFDLARFLEAQDKGVYDAALAEIQSGHKRTHWMWFIFPQLRGLGSSEYAERFGISGTAEAIAYLQHPVLSARLETCAAALVHGPQRSAEELFGEVDAKKLRSSATLFASVSEPDSIFHQLLDRFFDGERDPKTLKLISAGRQ